MREVLDEHLGRLPTYEDLPLILCGPEFEDLPTDPEEKITALRNAKESFQQFIRDGGEHPDCEGERRE